MNSFAVIRYFNYRKNVSFTILKTFDRIKTAEKYACSLAKKDFGKDLVKGVSERWVYVDSVLSYDGYTKGDGYDQYVYTVIEIPEPEYSYESESDYNSDEESYVESDEDESDDDDDELKIKRQDNGKYEWGFDLTDFADTGDREEGAEKFQELLDMFNLTFSRESNGFIWTNFYDDDWTEDKDALMLITGNNPITGEYTKDYNGKRNRDSEKGYLSYVGVTCNSRQTLKNFIEEFRSKATYIKGESNAREYI
jgi:hypothetical protein